MAPADEQSPPQSIGGRALHPDLINERVKATQYAMRGEMYTRAQSLEKSGRTVTLLNLGNPHALGQKPLSFNRQVLALCACPALLEGDGAAASAAFAPDAVRRARALLAATSGGGVGAYTDSRGLALVRDEVCEYIRARDGLPEGAVDPSRVYLTDGASAGAKLVLQCLVRGRGDGVMVPVPQYPLYSAAVELCGGTFVPYYLDEAAGWALDAGALARAAGEARAKGVSPRAIVVINPGNPTGQALGRESLEAILRFARQERLVVLADEVYQANVYAEGRSFESLRRVAHEMGPEYGGPAGGGGGEGPQGVELVSMHTVSKGLIGECGLRGGYMELHNIHPGAVEQMYKLASITLCPNVMGQLTVSLMVNEPRPGDESYESHAAEKEALYGALARRAATVVEALRPLEGVTCNDAEGALYVFPRLHLPARAVEAAKEAGKAPDLFYCLALLDATGLCTVPGSGFGQEDGTFHFRSTILPPEKDLPQMMEAFANFHKGFMAKYAAEA